MDDQRWETQALRESRARRSGRPAVSKGRRSVTAEPAMWVTLREASDATGIPVGTLGSWARRGTVESYLEGNGRRKLRIVDLNDVRGRARELGRPIAPVPVRRTTVAEANGGGYEPEPPSPAAPGLSPKGGETETMIVPLDAWNKMLNQLGNLHEAGQQLAEARERAAKAETEASFLRERLAELRTAEVSSPLGGGAERSAAEGAVLEREPPSPPSTEEAPSAAEQRSAASPPVSSPLGGGAERSEAEGAGGDNAEPWMPSEAEAAIENPTEPTPRRLWQSLYAGWKSRRR